MAKTEDYKARALRPVEDVDTMDSVEERIMCYAEGQTYVAAHHAEVSEGLDARLRQLISHIDGLETAINGLRARE